MNDWTPTTEVIRHAVSFQRERLGEPRPIKPEAFDRWLAQTLREAKAEALRDAADKLDGGYHPAQTGTLDWHGEVGFYGEADWLRALADEHLERTRLMTDIRAWLDQGKTLAEARTYAPFTAKPDEYGEKILLKSGGYSLQTGEWGDNDTIQPTANAKYVNHAIQALPQALDALQAVLDLHKRNIYGACTSCVQNRYPCPTVRAITDAIGDPQ